MPNKSSRTINEVLGTAVVAVAVAAVVVAVAVAVGNGLEVSTNLAHLIT